MSTKTENGKIRNKLKFEEIDKLEHTPHPMEFEMYYSS